MKEDSSRANLMDRDRNTVEKKYFSIRGSGKMERKTARENYIFLTGKLPMRVNLSATSEKETARNSENPEQCITKEAGKKERRTGRELYLTVMDRKLFPECSSKGNVTDRARNTEKTEACICLLYTSDAADD